MVEKDDDEAAGRVEAVFRCPRRVKHLRERRDLRSDLGRECEHGIFDVTKVLIEGRGRSADCARNLDDAQIADAVGFEQRGGRVEQFAAGLCAPLADRAAVERLHARAKSTNP